MGLEVDVGHRGPLHHLAGVHHGHPIGHARDHPQVMADVHDRRVEFALQVGDQVEHRGLDRHVQGRRRLIHDQQRRIVEQRHRDHDALLLAARNLVRIALHDVGRIRHIDALEHLDALGFRGRLAQAPMDDQHLGQLVAQKHRGVQRLHRILVDHRDAVAPNLAQILFRAAHQVLALEHDVALDDLAVAAQEIHDPEGDRALAAA